MRRYTPLQNFLVGLLLAAAVAASVLLLVSAGRRRHLILLAGREWSRLIQSDKSRGIFQLPPPPPRPLETHILVPPPPAPPAGGDDLQLEGKPLERQPEREEAEPGKTREARAAFEKLQAVSPLAAGVVRGENNQFRFQDWKPVRSRPPEFWIDLIAERRADGITVHLIWSVDGRGGEVRPLSQAARDLTRQKTSSGRQGSLDR